MCPSEPLYMFFYRWTTNLLASCKPMWKNEKETSVSFSVVGQVWLYWENYFAGSIFGLRSTNIWTLLFMRQCWVVATEGRRSSSWEETSTWITLITPYCGTWCHRVQINSVHLHMFSVSTLRRNSSMGRRTQNQKSGDWIPQAAAAT